MVRQLIADAFAREDGGTPVEVVLIDRLRAGAEWLPVLSLVAELRGEVAGHVVCSRAFVRDQHVLALGPLAVWPGLQRTGIGSALMHAVLGAADALGEPLVVLLGDPRFYARFGFRPAAELGIDAAVAGWGAGLQARQLTGYRSDLTGVFRFAPAFDGL